MSRWDLKIREERKRRIHWLGPTLCRRTWRQEQNTGNDLKAERTEKGAGSELRPFFFSKKKKTTTKEEAAKLNSLNSRAPSAIKRRNRMPWHCPKKKQEGQKCPRQKVT